MSAEIHQSDIGTALRTTIYDGTTVVDISSATITFYFKKPDNSATVEKSGELVNDGTDGLCQYVSTSGFFDVVGDWDFQVKIVIGAYSWRTNIETFKVHTNL